MLSSSKCISCLVVVLSVVVVIPSITSLPVFAKDSGRGITPEEVQIWAATIMRDMNDGYGHPTRSLSDLQDAYGDSNTELDPSLTGLYPSPLKRNQRIYSSRRTVSKKNSLNELIRRLMALQGQRMPEGRASMMRFGSGRK